jgi:hypothetical protein
MSTVLPNGSTPRLAERAPDYESGGQEFESLRARQQGIDAIDIFLNIHFGNLLFPIYIATLSPRETVGALAESRCPAFPKILKRD